MGTHMSHDTQALAPVTVYVIYLDRAYLHKAGWGHRFEWTNDLVEAKLYASEAAMKRDLSKVANAYVHLGYKNAKYPEVLVFTMTWSQTIDQSEHLKKNRERAEKAERTREANAAKRQVEHAQLAVERARKELEWREQEAAKVVEYARRKNSE